MKDGEIYWQQQQQQQLETCQYAHRWNESEGTGGTQIVLWSFRCLRVAGSDYLRPATSARRRDGGQRAGSDGSALEQGVMGNPRLVLSNTRDTPQLIYLFI